MDELTQDYLREILDYNPIAGDFFWKVSLSSNIKAGQVAGYKTVQDYIVIKISGKKYFAHRLAWLHAHGNFPEDQIDHINHVKDDNSLKNLRACSRSENFANRKKQQNNTSGYKGVVWDKEKRKWRARIGHGRKLFYIGRYKDIKDAAVAYNKKALELFGEFACLNKIASDGPAQLKQPIKEV